MDKYNIEIHNKLNDLLKSYSATETWINDLPQGILDGDSTFEHVAEFFNSFHWFENEYEKRKQNSPNFKTALELWIAEIENRIHSETIQSFNLFSGEYSTFMFSTAFDKTTMGKTNYLKDYVVHLLIKLPYDENNTQFRINESALKEIADGVLFAHKLPFLKEEYKKLSNENSEIQISADISNNNQQDEINKEIRLKWSGTPSQFGFIIDLLIQGGYIERPTSNYTKDADFYLKCFAIEATPATIAKELSEKSNSLSVANRIKFKIPNKSNLS